MPLVILESSIRHISMLFLPSQRDWVIVYRNNCLKLVLKVLKSFYRSPNYSRMADNYFWHLFEILKVSKEKYVVYDIFANIMEMFYSEKEAAKKFWETAKAIGNASPENKLYFFIFS